MSRGWPCRLGTELSKRTREGDGDERADEDIQEHKRQAIELVMCVNEVAEEYTVGADWAVDDVNGEPLDAEDVRDSRAEELAFMHKFGVYEEAGTDECWARTGKAPITTRWIDRDKGRNGEKEIRWRWVARDFKVKGEKDREDVFAAMPPLEAKKLIFRMAAAQEGAWRRGGSAREKLLFIDVKKAHLNGVVEECDFAYIKLPTEDGMMGKCMRLKRWLYGMRPAANAWEKDYADRLKGVGFVQGASAPTVFYNPETGLRCVVHGDDFTFLGVEIELKKIEKEMRGWYALKVRGMLGGGLMDDKEIVILNRRLRWGPEGVEYEADPKHSERLCAEFGLGAESRGLDGGSSARASSRRRRWRGGGVGS